MPNYNTQFSFAFLLPNEEAVSYALKLVTIADTLRSQSGNDPTAGEPHFPEELIDCVDDWSFEATNYDSANAIWIHSDSGGEDAACHFVQHLLDKFGVTEAITFEWANTCTKPCLDAFGGGAVVITATDIKSMTTSQWLYEQLHGPQLTQPHTD